MTPAAAGLAVAGAGAAALPPAGPAPIRLMLVDDSATARSVLARMISAHPGLVVVAEAGSAAQALDVLRAVEVDIVLLDVEMPGGSGLEALPEILRRGRGARVLIVSSLCEDGAAASVEALALGAADTLPKPGTGQFAGRFSEVLADRLRRLGRARRTGPAPVAAPAPVRLRAMSDHRPGALGIAASTGGIHALTAFLAALPPRIGIPILVTQHLPALFMPFFARQLENAGARPARVAEDGDPLEPDRILVAPGDAHLGLRRRGTDIRVSLATGKAMSGCCPSADPMLAALADAYGRGAVGVMLSGMGRDGLAGSGRLVQSGGTMLAQDEASASVWGMPRAVAEAGHAAAILPPADLARRIAAAIGSGAW